MKKNISFVFVFIIVFFMFYINVFAKKYTCTYIYQEKNEVKTEIQIDTDAKTIGFDATFFKAGTFLLDPYIKPEWTAETLIDEYIYDKEKQRYTCPTIIHLCDVQHEKDTARGEGAIPQTEMFPLINSNLKNVIMGLEQDKIIDLKTEGDKRKGAYEKWYIVDSAKCYDAALYEDESDAVGKDLDIGCDKYDELYGNLKKFACLNPDDLNTCSQSNLKNNIDSYKKTLEQLKQFCKQNLKYSISKDPCTVACLNLKNDLAVIKVNSNDNGVCGFSGKLISFISNIIRWAKYILPVIVIVLGILDFMKAIGADKEDEMKKAQQRFIKRLIAAALLFIVPLILEFVLDKMGFGYDDCGLF